MSTPGSLAHATAAYLQALRPHLQRANESRRGWISQVGLLLADRQHGTSSEVIAAVAARSGETQGRAFRSVRADLASLEPAPGCESCHMAVIGWLDKQIAACDLLIEIGRTRETGRLREVQGLIAEARQDSRQFSYEIAERRAALGHRRRAVAAARGRASRRWRGRTSVGPQVRLRAVDGEPAVRVAAADGATPAASLWGRLVRLFGGDGPDLAGTAG
jgi:hypothetical protein